LTRFDTDHRDFDQRLAQVIHGADGSFAKGFWMHKDVIYMDEWDMYYCKLILLVYESMDIEFQSTRH
jgi:hypothetical protein